MTMQIADVIDFPVHGDHNGSLVALEKGELTELIEKDETIKEEKKEGE